jgi:hypothetical protein
MKKFIKIVIIAAIACVPLSCTDDFADVNKNPAMVTDPDIRHLFTSSIYDMGHGGRYTEWFYNNYNYFYRYNQATIFSGGNSGDFNRHGATGGASPYGVMTNLFEIRKRIDDMSAEEQAKRTHVNAITFVPPVIKAIPYSDMRGSIPWSEAMKGRYENHYTPKYDTQKELYEQWLVELNAAISVLLSDASDQVTYGPQDFIYNGDFAKWARLANTIKLRIAVRLEHQDKAWMQQIINEALANPAGLITLPEHEMIWAPSTNYRGEAQDFWGAPTAARNFVSKLVELRDPRTHFFFDPNHLSQAAVDLLSAQGKNLPGWVNPEVPVTRWDRYRGGPVAPDLAGQLPWFGPLTDDSGTGYARLSHINRRFFNPHYDGGNGYWKEYMVSAAEVALYMAEFIEKGYVSGQGTAAQWYENGVRASFNAYNDIARTAGVYDFEAYAATEAQVDAYVSQADVALNGSNDLEKIYFQQYINFFRYPDQQFALVRRTGFPSKDGQIMPWEPVLSNNLNLALPRRFGVNEPSNPINIINWRAAIDQQGFTVGTIEGDDLNRERVWWDLSSPNFGDGSW